MEISSSIKDIIPHFKLGIIHYKNIEVSDSPQMLKGRFRLFQESLFFELEEKNINELPGIKIWRELFKKIGTDPNRYRPSNEALYRRIKKQQYIGTVHSAADLNNFFSLQYEIPLGIYDSDKLNGKIELRIGTETDHYLAINNREVNMQHKFVTADETGAFGSPFVDSKRTAVTLETKNAVQIIYLEPSMEEKDRNELLSSLAEMFTQIHGGEADIEIIT
ncbi:B3/B4 domain-containing protein [Metabacillus arenae]|uniref:B3/B4 tRNA-binding domain-containing protein n=1 Tax=Metabacillus arenae TaxID=2771434 RepID=A0A926NJQ3_9BACI|nr:phenylalanine--tRNA ligase beta subunit-related protein [Metabacillus arenae]MBD1382330.1 hypothetical protein [Metabacillus arenae]